jgi:hypothetical protein
MLALKEEKLYEMHHNFSLVCRLYFNDAVLNIELI